MKPINVPMDKEEWDSLSEIAKFIHVTQQEVGNHVAVTFEYLFGLATIESIFPNDSESSENARVKAIEELGYVMFAALTNSSKSDTHGNTETHTSERGNEE